MADAVATLFGGFGVVTVVLAAVQAPTGMANAGVLAWSLLYGRSRADREDSLGVVLARRRGDDPPG